MSNKPQARIIELQSVSESEARYINAALVDSEFRALAVVFGALKPYSRQRQEAILNLAAVELEEQET